MIEQQTDIQSKAVELAGDAFAAFCEDMSAMFGLQAGCQCMPGAVDSFANITKRVPKLSAVHVVKADGAINGTFYIVFDAKALFILSGSVKMLPKTMILNHTEMGTQKEAEELRDATQAVGTLLIGAWDRVFHEHLKGHGHFVKGPTFIGEFQDISKQDAGIAVDGQYTIVDCEINVSEFPVSHCIVMFPQSIWNGTAEKKPADVAKPAETPKPTQDAKTAETPKPADTATPAEIAKTAEAVNPAELPKPEEIAKPIETPKAEAEAKPQETAADNVQKPADAGSQNATAPQAQPVEQPAVNVPEVKPADEVPAEPADAKTVIATDDSSVTPNHSIENVKLDSDLSAITAGDIMDRNTIWASPEDSVEVVEALMEQHNTGYVFVGSEGVCQGIISRSNIAEAISPFLLPMFAKWRRSLDESSLQIKVKWIMSTPVHTARLYAKLDEVVNKMCNLGCRCLPVVNADGKVMGIITVFDALKVMMNSSVDTHLVDEQVQLPHMI